MEIFVAGEILPDQFRTDHVTIANNKAAARLMREKKLGDAGETQGIDQAGDQGHQHDQHDGGADLFQHGLLLQARPAAVTAMSISLMPMKGTMIPPSP